MVGDFSTIPYNFGLSDDKMKEECGVFAIFDRKDAAALTALGLHALQHRGQEAAGITSTDGQLFHNHAALGLVGDNFNREDVIKGLDGNHAIGHVRYSTTGRKNMRNVQPLFAELSFGGFALGHNGNLTNAAELREKLVSDGCLFRTTMDTEVIIHLIAMSDANSPVDALIDALKKVEGAYSLVAMTSDSIIGARDPNGVRPLALGRLGDSVVLASETCAFDIIGAKYERDVEPGEIVVIKGKDEIISYKPFQKTSSKFCIFEYVYFARPDSLVEGKAVYNFRKNMGRVLSKENPVQADIVVPVPDSGIPAAMGYAEESKIPFELGIIRNHYVGRTFIEPTEQVRHLGVKLKHNANLAIIKGKKVVLIDDSIVRGTTSKKIVSMIREAGAKEVHMRISSPQTTNSCFYGIDTPEKSELLASKMDLEGMREFIGVDTLHFLSIDGLYQAVGEAKRNKEIPQYCDACFTGEYPISIPDKKNNILPLFEERKEYQAKLKENKIEA